MKRLAVHQGWSAIFNKMSPGPRIKTLVWVAGEENRQRGNMNGLHVSALTGSEDEEVNEAEEGILFNNYSTRFLADS